MKTKALDVPVVHGPSKGPQYISIQCICVINHSQGYVEIRWEKLDDLDGWDEGVGRTEVQEGGDICIHITDSLCCAAETNTTL